MKVVCLVFQICVLVFHSLHIAFRFKYARTSLAVKAWRHSTPLPEVLRDLLGPEVAIDAVTTACFSQCQNGPNICVKRKNERTGQDDARD
jgi:hypothetical protein